MAEFLPSVGFEVAALVDRDPAVVSFLPGVPLLHGRDELDAWRASRVGDVAALVAIGGIHGRERVRVQRELAESGYQIPIVVHPRAFVARDALLGAGTQVLALAAVCAGARLGAGCIVNTGASVDHECELDDGVHVGPGAALAGNVRVGSHAFIGIGSTVIPHVCIGADAVIGAGSVLVKNVAPGALVYGNPARSARPRPPERV